MSFVAPRQLKQPGTCRIFFSSPFNGMEGEREELTKKYFPQLRHLCSDYGLQFVAVDMRWGITTEAANTAQVINICLQEIDRSDVFVGFFGQRYGWHGEADELLQKNFEAAASRYQWLDRKRDKSVTELEFLHGHLNNPGKLPACIFFRDQAFDDKWREEGERLGNKLMISKFSAESAQSISLMDDLKRRVKDTENKCLMVHMAYPDPEQGALCIFEAIWSYLNDVLLCGDAVTDVHRKNNQLLSLDHHDAFIATRCQLYFGADTYMDQLNNYISSNSFSANPILVLGESGCGKSALLCNWLQQLLSSASGQSPIICYHFVGCAQATTGILSILRRIHEVLTHHLQKNDSSEQTASATDQLTDYKHDDDDEISIIRSLLSKVVHQLNQCEASGRTVILIIDGLNRVDKAAKTGKPLFWLPTALPSCAHLIVSMVTDDEESIVELRDKRSYQLLHVEPLTTDIKTQLCVASLKQRGKEMSPSQLDKVSQCSKTANPLFLKIILEELCMFGYFFKLDEKIDSLISTTSVEELFQQYLQRLESDYNVQDADSLVQNVMSSIFVSHDGLSESELKDIYDIPSHIWSPLYFAMENYLVDRSGLLGFGFTELADAVQQRYLNSSSTRSWYEKKLAAYFETKRKSLPIHLTPKDPIIKRISQELTWLYRSLDNKEALRNILSDLRVFERLQQDAQYELLEYWQCTGYSSTEIGKSYLSAFDDRLTQLYLYAHDTWNIDGKFAPGVQLYIVLANVSKFLSVGQYVEGQELVLLRLKDLLYNIQDQFTLKEEHQKELHSTLYSLACLYVDLGRFEEAEPLHKAVMDYRSKLLDDSDSPESWKDMRNLAMSFHGVGVLYLKLEKYDEAEDYLNKSKNMHARVPYDQDKWCTECSINLGNVCMGRNQYEEAIQHLTEALNLYEKAYFGELPPEVGFVLLNMGLCHRRLGHIDEAGEHYLKSLEIKKKSLGEDHPKLAETYMNLGTVECIRRNTQKEEEYCRKILEIYQESVDSELFRVPYVTKLEPAKIPQTTTAVDLSLDLLRDCTQGIIYLMNNTPTNMEEVLFAKENLARCLIVQMRHAEAVDLYWQAFDGLKVKNSLSKSIPFIHTEMAAHFFQAAQYDMVRKIVQTVIGIPQLRSEVTYIQLAHLDSLLPENERPVRPHEWTISFALTMWPDSLKLITFKATSELIPQGRLEELLALLDAGQVHGEGLSAEFYQEVAGYCGGEGREDMLVEVMRAALKYHPNNVIILANIIMSYRELRNYTAIIPYAHQLYAASPNDVKFQMYAAESLCVAGELQQGRSLFLEISQKYSDSDEIKKKVEHALTVIDQD